MPARFFFPCPDGLQANLTVDLPEGVSRHIQVLRMQPGEQVILFDGQEGGEWNAEIVSMGRKLVQVRIGQHLPVARELTWRVTLAMGMPTNDRMDGLIEKATELGVDAIQPLVCERSVLRLDGERAAKKVQHWQAVAVAAAEQSGRTKVPTVHPVRPLHQWVTETSALPKGAAGKGLLSLSQATPIQRWAKAMAVSAQANGLGADPICYFMSGPEGGLSPQEEQLAIARGWQPVSLGPRVLRADTAPLAALSVMAANWDCADMTSSS